MSQPEEKGRHPQSGSGSGDVGQHDVTSAVPATEQVLIINQAAAEDLLAARFGWPKRSFQSFDLSDPSGDEPPDEEGSLS